MWKNFNEKIAGNLLDKLASKLYTQEPGSWHKWIGHLEIFSHPQAKENSGQYSVPDPGFEIRGAGSGHSDP